MGKEPSPIEKCVKEADVLRKQVDKIVKESNKNAANKKLKDKEIKLKANLKSCRVLKPEVTALLQKAEDLSEENEPSKVRNFENKKKQEIRRIQAWQTQLEEAMTKLYPEEAERDALIEEIEKEVEAEEEEKEDEKEDKEDADKDETSVKEVVAKKDEKGKKSAKDKKSEKDKKAEKDKKVEKDKKAEKDKKSDKDKKSEKDKKTEEAKKDEKVEDDDEEVEDESEDEYEDDEEDDDEVEAEETLEIPKKEEKAKVTKKEIPAAEESEEEVEEEESEVEDDEEYEEVTDDEGEEEETEEKIVPKSTKETKAVPKVTEEESEEESDEEEVEEEESEEEGEEEESGEEEEEEEEEQDDMEVTTSGRLFEALDDYEGEKEKGDLPFEKGQVLTILKTRPNGRDDGWWEAENEKGEKGNVPSTYLIMYNKYKDVQKSDEEEEEDEDEEEEEDEEEGEEGAEGETPRPKKKKRQKSGKELWSGIKKAVKEQQSKTSVTDVLHALGALPSGFRLSTLGQLFNSDNTYRMKNYLAPKLSTSNFSYKDLFFDPSTNKIRARLSKEQRIITLSTCRQIPVPGAGLDVTGRHVRMCLFDGQTILSNIHTVKVTSVDREQRTWSFSTRVSEQMDTYPHAEVFIRTNYTNTNIGILFELCCSYMRTSTKETGEFSAGWVHLPFEDNGILLQNKSYDLQVNGGTPYEKGVEVDPSISRRTSNNAFMSLISGNKQPRLIVRVSVPKREQKELIDTLPDTLVGNTCLLSMYSYYRQLLADSLLRDRLDLESTELIHSPTLATFPIVADQHDLMRVLRDTWYDKIRGVRRAEMRDAEFMKDMFRKTVMESVYPLLHTAGLPQYKSGDSDNELLRRYEIDNFKQQKIAKRGILALLLSAEMAFEPMDLKEVSFNAIGPYCLPQHGSTHVPVETS